MGKHVLLFECCHVNDEAVFDVRFYSALIGFVDFLDGYKFYV